MFIGKLSPFVCASLAAFITLASFYSLPSQADSGYRWFEVEVLIFRHPATRSSDPEQFPIPVTPIPVNNARDLITPTLHAHIDGLLASAPRCSWMRDLPAGVGELTWPIRPYAVTSLPDLRSDIFCRPHEERIITDRLYPSTPPQLTGSFWQDRSPTVVGEGGDVRTAESPFLLTQEGLTFTQLRSQMERRNGSQVLLHTSWRQPVFTRNRSPAHRLFGGKNFSEDFDYLGFARPHVDTDAARLDGAPMRERDRLQQQLNSVNDLLNAVERGEFRFARVDSTASPLPSPPSQYPRGLPSDVWELDGLFQLYLVGNYLHINSQLNVREPVEFPQQLTSAPEQVTAWRNGGVERIPFLRGYYLNQLRRIISHEVHYFDHDRFGMLVQVRRTELSDRR